MFVTVDNNISVKESNKISKYQNMFIENNKKCGGLKLPPCQ